MVPDDEKYFTIHTDIEVSPQFFGWVYGLGKAVRILAPAEVVEEMGNYVKGIAEMYYDDSALPVPKSLGIWIGYIHNRRSCGESGSWYSP